MLSLEQNLARAAAQARFPISRRADSSLSRPMAYPAMVSISPTSARKPLSLGTVGTVADQQQLGGNLLAHPVEDFDHVEHAFHGPEVGQMNQDALVIRGVLAALSLETGLAHVLIAIYEVGNDLDVVLDVEDLDGAVAQIVRDGGDPVALLDG